MPAVFSKETQEFLRDLHRHNSKAWMDANRNRYQKHVVAPFRALLDELAPVALKLNPRFIVSGRTGENFSRINRDIRFSKDKTPYRPQMYLTFSAASKKQGSDGQLYVGISHDSLTAGFRIYADSKECTLVHIARSRGAQQSKRLAATARRLRGKYDSYWYTQEKVGKKKEWMKHDGWPLKPQDWERIEGWIVRKKLKPAVATRPEFTRDVAKIFAEVYALYKFTSMGRDGGLKLDPTF